MKVKKQIKNDIKKILETAGLDGPSRSKVLNRLVNYAYKKSTVSAVGQSYPEKG